MAIYSLLPVVLPWHKPNVSPTSIWLNLTCSKLTFCVTNWLFVVHRPGGHTICWCKAADCLLRVPRVGRKPSETDSIKSQISSKTSRGEKGSIKRRHQRHHSDSQVNSYFPYRWSPTSLTLNIYFCLFLYMYLYITRTTINNGTPHLKPPKNQNRRAALGWPAIK